MTSILDTDFSATAASIKRVLPQRNSVYITKILFTSRGVDP